MNRIRFRVPTYDEGQILMKKFADKLSLDIEEVDADLKIQNDNIRITCHFDEGNFCFFLIKTEDKLLDELKPLFESYMK